MAFEARPDLGILMSGIHISLEKQMSRCTTKPQNDKCIHQVWSESSLCAEWVAKDPMLLHANSEDSDQTGWTPRLIWVFARRTVHSVDFVVQWPKYIFVQEVSWLIGIDLLTKDTCIFVMCIYMSRAMRKRVMSYANNKGADQTAHPRSLISAFVVRCLDSIISLNSIAEISRL